MQTQSEGIDPRGLGGRLLEAKRARGLTQQDVTEHLGVARTTVVAMENGERVVQPNELVALAKLYGRSLHEAASAAGAQAARPSLPV